MKKYFLSILFFTIIFSFSTKFALSQDYSFLPNLSAIYSPSSTYLHPKYKLFIKKDSVVDIYVKMNIKELNFIQLANKNFQAKLKIKYIFYKSIEKTEIIDSSSNIYTLNKRNINESLITKFEITIPQENCFLVLITQDLYNKKKSVNFIRIDELQNSSANFLLLDSATNLPVFSNLIKSHKCYYLNTSFNVDSFKISKYAIDSTFPKPPYSSDYYNYQPDVDTQFNIKNRAYFKFKEQGIYKINISINNASLCIINFGEYYPDILTPEDMIFALRYFASTDEYEKLTNTINKKLAVDNFWLTKNSSPDKARNLIKIYYNRVMLANKFFTSNKEGWKTDRGMIYIIFGPPNILHKADQAEEWIYYNTFSGRKISYIFNREVDINLIENYRLNRNTSYINSWKYAIQQWNNGNIYSF